DDYQDEALELHAPRNDVALVAEALRLLGFRAELIATLLSSQRPSLTTARMRVVIDRFLRGNAAEEDELTLYISGHGIDQDRERLLLPVDYFRDYPQRPSELIGDHWLWGVARSSPARSVLIILDTCREGIKFQLAADDIAKSATAQYPLATPT